MVTLNITLSEEARRFVEEQAAREGLASPGQYVERLVAHAQRLSSDVDIEQKLLDGLASGPPIEADEAYWERKTAELVARREMVGHRL